MAVNLSPVGGVAAQFFTNTGAVLTGGKLYTYLAGTTTPAAAYTSSNGATAWTNPIVLDSAGRVSGSGEIWITDGILYKFLLKDANDVLIATYDNISGINSNFIAFVNQQEIVTATAGQTVFNLGISYQPGTNSLSVFVDGVNQYGPGALYAYTETDSDTVTFTSGLHVGAEVKFTTTQQQSAGAVSAAQVSFTGFKGQVGTVQDLADNDGSNWIGFQPAGTGAVARSAQEKMRDVFSVLDFGADPTGVTDSTTAINNALAAIYTSGTKGAKLVFPQGTYLCKVNINGLTNNSMGENGLCISGYGAILKGKPTESSVICVSGAVAGTPIVPPVNTYANGLRIEGFTIDMTGMPAAASTYAIAIQLSYNSSIEDIHVIYEPNAGGGLFLGNQVYTYAVRNLNTTRVWLLGFNNTTNQTSTCSFWSLVANQVIIKNCFDISFFAPTIQGSLNHFILDDANTINIIGGDLEGTGGFVYDFRNSTRNVNSIANTPGGYTNTTYSTGLAYNSNLSDRPPFGGQGIGTYGRVNSPGRVILSATTAQTIYEFLDTAANQGTGLVAVFGDDGSNGFADLVLCAYSAVAVVSSNTMYGAPPTRTYTFANNQLKLARSAATSGTIKAVLTEFLTSN